MVNTIEKTFDVKECPHKWGFHCQSEGDYYIMCCNARCGFFLNFSPDAAGEIRQWKNNPYDPLWTGIVHFPTNRVVTDYEVIVGGIAPVTHIRTSIVEK